MKYFIESLNPQGEWRKFYYGKIQVHWDDVDTAIVFVNWFIRWRPEDLPYRIINEAGDVIEEYRE